MSNIDTTDTNHTNQTSQRAIQGTPAPSFEKVEYQILIVTNEELDLLNNLIELKNRQKRRYVQNYKPKNGHTKNFKEIEKLKGYITIGSRLPKKDIYEEFPFDIFRDPKLERRIIREKYLL
jgi:hypothetical protein